MLISDYKADYIIIDTSSGIRYWSINALVVADALLLTLKMADLDIVGTRELLAEIYGSFTKFGTKSFLLCNRISGYCVPLGVRDDTTLYTTTRTTATGTYPLYQPSLKSRSSLMMEQATETDVKNLLKGETGIEVVSAIPCYCDIQFSRKEFLTVLYQPEHPFTKQFEQLVRSIELLLV